MARDLKSVQKRLEWDTLTICHFANSHTLTLLTKQGTWLAELQFSSRLEIAYQP
ncbi:hypothetical protein PCPL58_3496 [Pseudomonas cerasi]|uniref:Uncharacterized protein n=1 Tax=Pseudomonas cerasi TaxID=1583341 RepID=A0A193SUT7_9PSED|nr:hypothetical protein PCPL58_3496 [Pseudomonas cerasi]SOS21673.1 hypothetical protein PL963_03583 [Pseudomonas cerasi]